MSGWTASLLRRMVDVGMQEDAMIGMRHLRNLLDGKGLVYNPGEGVVGVTDPLFWLGSALFHVPGKFLGASDLIVSHYAYVWGVVVVALVLLATLGKGARMPLAAGMGALLFAYFVAPLRFMFLGLEGPFLLLSVGVLGWLYRRATPTVFYAAAAFLSWNRPEVAIAALPLLVFFSLFRVREHGWVRALGPVVVGGAVFPLTLWLLTGSPIVQTIVAKSYFGARISLSQMLMGLGGRLEQISSFLEKGQHSALLLTVIVTAIAAHDFVRFLVSKPKSAPSAALLYSMFCVAYTGFIILVPNLWEWYITNWLGFVLVLLAGRFAALVDVATLRSPRFQLTTVVAVLVGVAILVRPQQPVRRALTTSLHTWLKQENEFRGRLGRELATEWNAKSVWMEAVGWQGYYNSARVFDEVGLVDRDTLALAKKFKCRYFVAALLELKPQFIVKRRFEVEQNRLMLSPKSCPGAPLFESDADRALFFQHYELVREYNTEIPDLFGEYSYLNLYRLRESPLTQG
ncbi:hypothetical protein [Myxococcus hansupus]|nr:hypothetical protein [Myxococcus hansupus]